MHSFLRKLAVATLALIGAHKVYESIQDAKTDRALDSQVDDVFPNARTNATA